MPRGVKNASTTVAAVNGVEEVDRLTPGFELSDDEAMTIEHEGRYKVITPRAVNFTSYEVKFIEGIGRTDDLTVANRLRDEFHYRVIDTHHPGQRIPVPEPLSEAT
jgi:hypothetical protein